MSYALSAVGRTEKGEKSRNKSTIPAVVYGAGGQTISISLGYDEFIRLNESAGAASLIDLSVDGKDSGKVLIQDVQYDPVSDMIIHADLRRIDMNKEMTAVVELHFVGEVPVIKEQGGTLVRNVEKVEVKCLPKDLVSHIDVDLSVLKTFDNTIKIKDLPVPAGIVITNPHAEDLVAKASPALTEDEIKAMEAAATTADLSTIETAGKKKEEEAEAGEGEGEKTEEAADAKAAPAKKE